jgi:hypothetical protein
MDSFKNLLFKFFGVAVRGRTYLNLLYLLLAFPLGLFYFIFLVTGLSTGIPLMVVGVGFFIVLAVFLIWYGLAAFEREMAIGLLGETIPPMTRQDLSGKSLWQQFTATLANPVTWKGLGFLVAKFPIGIITFSVVVALGSVCAAFLGAPFYYQFAHPQVTFFWGVSNPWVIDSLPEALLLCLGGVFATLISLHIFNGMAWLCGRFARVMLGSFSAAPRAPEAPAAPAAPQAPQAPEAGVPSAAG